MRILMRILVALRALSEGTRFFLAVLLLCVAGVFVFISWGALTAAKFASISRVFSPAGAEGADSSRGIDNPENVFEQLKSGFRDMGSLFRGGILPDLSEDSAGAAGPAGAEEGTEPLPSTENSEFEGNGDEYALPWNAASSSPASGSNTSESAKTTTP